MSAHALCARWHIYPVFMNAAVLRGLGYGCGATMNKLDEHQRRGPLRLRPPAPGNGPRSVPANASLLWKTGGLLLLAPTASAEPWGSGNGARSDVSQAQTLLLLI